MDELAVIRDVAQRLERAGIAYMLTGSLAMSFYAQPRMTRDVDVVVEVGEVGPDRIYGLFAGDYYVSLDAIREAVRYTSMFNVIHNASLVKVDLILRKDQPYRHVEFGRRQEVRLGDGTVSIVSKEDLILSKLYWARESRSEVQLRDVENLLASGFDRDYVEHWLRELGLDAWATRYLA